MGAVVTVAVIIGVFFVVGLVVGGIGVIALPRFRNRGSRRSWPRKPVEGPAEPEDESVTPEDESVTPEDAVPHDRPRWPGNRDNGDSGR